MATSRKQERSIPLAYAERYREFAPALPGADLPWLKTLRQEAIARFSALGLPSPRVEAWKYTNLGSLAKQPFVPSSMNAVLSATRACPFKAATRPKCGAGASFFSQGST